MQLFCDDKRAELKSVNPDTPFAEMAKLLGAAWKDAAPEEKAKYQEQHAVRFHLIAMAFCTASPHISVSPCMSGTKYNMLIHCQRCWTT
jgi:HMG (high mobility group) box